MKKIAICVPTYNRESYLVELLSTIPDDILIHISDNGNYVKSIVLKDNIKITHTDKVVSSITNWNYSIKNSMDTDYVAISSDDDTYIVNGFNIVKKYINNYDGDVFIFGNNFINENNQITSYYCPTDFEVIEPPYAFNKFLYGVNARTLCIFIKKSFLDQIGYLDEKKFTITAADSELIQRMMLLGKVVFIPEIVGNYRIWNNNETSKHITTIQWMNEIDIWTNKIIELANNKLSNSQNTFNWEKYKDEIYARNLLGGLNNLYKNRNYKKVWEHFISCRYPKNALLKTKIRLYKRLLLSKIKAFFVN